MPTLRSSTTSSPSSAGAATVARHAGLDPTDLVILFAVTDAGTPLTFTAPGFTQVYAGHSSGGPGAVEVGILVGTGLSAGGTFTVTPSASAWVHLAATAWIDAADVIVGADAVNDGAPLDAPSVTTTIDDAVVLGVFAQHFGGVSGTSPTASLLTAIGSAHGWVYTRGAQPTAGPAGALTFTPSSGSSSLAVQLAVQPPDDPPPAGTVVEVYDGTAWQPAVVEIYDGTDWQPATIT